MKIQLQSKQSSLAKLCRRSRQEAATRRNL
ncbi:hypothetical protein COLO4_16270 [Corchorus olitorius]|uniref:Uncharacterized protein n=1 Tax=Corchorus olitorius TaxID=93759 RepID=A0A1R3JIJ5_9ROSI|nr:hypothetical protein COLO4_16270 [Corchorus olitorius]